ARLAIFAAFSKRASSSPSCWGFWLQFSKVKSFQHSTIKFAQILALSQNIYDCAILQMGAV
ncbi:MAG: hypothetical protein KC643_08865, partial [Nitrospira sp.]|nr:hypothetical protein [Nitrospira sp.]